jgi:hypothetical protein
MTIASGFSVRQAAGVSDQPFPRMPGSLYIRMRNLLE